MRKLRGALLTLAVAIALTAVAFGGNGTTVQAASWKKMTQEKQKQPVKAYYSSKKATKVKLTVNVNGKKGSYTFTKSKVKSEIKKLRKAMKTGLTKKPGKAGKFTYKSGKLSVTLQIKKKSGTFTAKNGSKKLFSKSFTYKKYKKADCYLLTNKTGGSKLTMMIYNYNKGVSFRLNKGASLNWKKDQIARFGMAKGNKRIVAQSLLPYFMITKAQYK